MKRKILFPLLVVLIALFFTNPDKADFQNFIQKKLVESKAEESENQNSESVDILDGLWSRPASWIVKEGTERKNYFLFSVFVVGNGSEDNQSVYLGIFDRFIQTKKSEGLSIDIKLD